MAKAKRKKTIKRPDIKAKPDPKIPVDILSEFLEEKVKVRDMPNVKKIDNNFLWEKNGTQRYRINVWVEEYQAGRYYPKVYIKYSFFVHYSASEGKVNSKKKKIEDLTIEQTLDLETMKRSMF